MDKEFQQLKEKYLLTRSWAAFTRLFKFLNDNPLYKKNINEICLSVQLKNNYHLAQFYKLSDKLLEADYFIKKHNSINEKDKKGLFLSQLIACQRGDFSTSIMVLGKLENSGMKIDEEEYLRAVLLHNLVFENNRKVLSVVRELSKKEKLKEQTINTIYRAFENTNEYQVFEILISYSNGQEIMRTAPGYMKNIVKQVLVERLVFILDGIGRGSNE